MSEPKKVDRRKFIYAGLGAVALIAIGAAAYVAMNPPVVTQTVTTSTTVPTTSVVTTTVPTTSVVTTTVPTTSVVTTTVKKGYFWGDSPYENEETWYWTLTRAMHYYAEYLGDRVVTLDPHTNTDPQIRDIRYLVSEGIDGLMCAPTSMEGLVDVLDWAKKEKGVPIVCYDSDAKTPSVSIAIRVDSFTIGKQCAEKLIKVMKDDGVEPKGKVFIVYDRPENLVQSARKDGMESVLKEYPGLEITEYTAFSTMEKAKQAITQACQGIGQPVIVMATNMPQLAGAVEGLKSAGMATPRGKAGHVYVGGIDAGPDILAYMKEGLIDVAADQPNLFYGALAIKFLRTIKEKGENALPPIGATVISDPSKPEGPQADGTYNIVIPPDLEFAGVKPFKYPVWAPCKVADFSGHRWLQVSAFLVTPDIADTAPIWANVCKIWFGKG